MRKTSLLANPDDRCHDPDRACNFPGGAAQSPTPDQAFLNTAVAQTVEAVNAAATAPRLPWLLLQQYHLRQIHQNPRRLQRTHRDQPSPRRPHPQRPFVPGVPMISAVEDTNCRFGPAPDYGAIGYFLKTDGKAPVKGRNSSNSWWFIVNPEIQLPMLGMGRIYYSRRGY